MSHRTYRFRSETRTLTDRERSAASGSFIALPDGVVHYELSGPAEGQPVVLVHGFSVPYYVWDPIYGPLAEAGYRVLRYDLYGRGLSDRPDVAYDRELYDRQLLGLMQALALERQVDLVGMSMGGPVVARFAQQHPDRVRKLVLIDPAGLPQKLPRLAGIVELPWVGELIMDWFGDRLLLSSLDDDCLDRERLAAYKASYREQMQYAGFKRALLSTLRHGLLKPIPEAYEAVGGQARSLLLIWGSEDKVVPVSLAQVAQTLMPQAQLHIVQGAGHVPHYQRPDAVLPILLEFLRQDVSPASAQETRSSRR